MKRIAIAASLLLVAAAIAGVARPEGAHAVDGTAATSSDSITVAGNGSVSGVPTSASFSFGVDVRAASAKAAIAANAREMRQVIAAVKSAGGRNVGHAVGVSLPGLHQQRRAVGIRGLERRHRDDRPRQGRRADRRRCRGGREPGERPDDVGRRPGIALSPGAQGRDGRRPPERGDARCRGGPVARQGDDGGRERWQRPPADVREGGRRGQRDADRGGDAGDDRAASRSRSHSARADGATLPGCRQGPAAGERAAEQRDEGRRHAR